mmetsp:Transcript_33946/g.96174  ORF Transcript_33946/g.96174 Transcript_33946/m.96174 type:complete len:353 (-) Transcript_33946:1690-2748(-)
MPLFLGVAAGGEEAGMVSAGLSSEGFDMPSSPSVFGRCLRICFPSILAPFARALVRADLGPSWASSSSISASSFSSLPSSLAPGGLEASPKLFISLSPGALDPSNVLQSKEGGGSLPVFPAGFPLSTLSTFSCSSSLSVALSSMDGKAACGGKCVMDGEAGSGLVMEGSFSKVTLSVEIFSPVKPVVTSSALAGFFRLLLRVLVKFELLSGDFLCGDGEGDSVGNAVAKSSRDASEFGGYTHSLAPPICPGGKRPTTTQRSFSPLAPPRSSRVTKPALNMLSKPVGPWHMKRSEKQSSSTCAWCCRSSCISSVPCSSAVISSICTSAIFCSSGHMSSASSSQFGPMRTSRRS